MPLPIECRALAWVAVTVALAGGASFAVTEGGSPPQTSPAPQTAPAPRAAASPQTSPAPQTAPAAPETAPAGAPTHEATDFQLTLSRGGQDLFTLHARHSATYGASYTDLDNVTLAGNAGPVPGLRVRARRGRYHPASGNFTLEGNVVAGRPGELEAHVDRIVYRADEGVARSQEAVLLTGRKVHGSARGLEVAPAQNRLTLVSEVSLELTAGGRQGRQVDLKCGRLDYVLTPPHVDCLDGARAASGERTLEARSLHMDLRESDRRPLKATLEEQARVSLTVPPPAAGAPASPLRGFPAGTAVAVAGERLDLDFDPDLGLLRALSAPSGGSIDLRPLAESDEFRTLRAAWLRLALRTGSGSGISAPESLEARGNVIAAWRDARGPGELRSGSLSSRWSARDASVESVHLTGGWSLERPDVRGTGSEADADSLTVELRGAPDAFATLERGGRSLAAARLRLPRGAGDWSGEGGVQVHASGGEAVGEGVEETGKIGTGGSAWMPMGGGQFWVTAQTFEVDPRTWLWRFEQEVRAWQESNLIEADRLEVNEQAHTLGARGHVVTRAVAGSRPGQSGPDLIWVRAPRLDYAEESRHAEYRGGVELIHDTSHLAAREMDVWLAARQGEVERVNARGEVQVAFQDALGEAERAEYAPAGRRLRLWTPGGTARARRRDGSQALSGQELTFEGSSDRIAVRSGIRGRSWVVFRDAP